jgi:hypothetical protein
MPAREQHLRESMRLPLGPSDDRQKLRRHYEDSHRSPRFDVVATCNGANAARKTRPSPAPIADSTYISTQLRRAAVGCNACAQGSARLQQVGRPERP